MIIQIRDRQALSQYRLPEIVIDAIVGMRLNACDGSTRRDAGGDYPVSATEVLTALACCSRPAYELALENALFTGGGYIVFNRYSCEVR